MKQRIFVATLGFAVAAAAIGFSARSSSADPTKQVVPSGAPTVFTSPLPSPTASGM